MRTACNAIKSGTNYGICFTSGDVAGQLFAVLPNCFGDTFYFNCTVSGDMNGVIHWRVDKKKGCLLPHTTIHDRPCWPGSPFMATTEIGFGTDATSFSSTLSGTASSTLDGTLVECFGPAFSRDARNMVGNSTLHIIGQMCYFLGSLHRIETG